MEISKLKRKRLAKTYTWKIISLILLILLVFSFYSNGSIDLSKRNLTPEEAKQRATDFLSLTKENTAHISVTVDKVIETDGLYELYLSVTTRDVTQKTTAYMTKDGKYFFNQAVDLEEVFYLMNKLETVEEIEEIKEETEPIEEEPEILEETPNETEL